jgi:ABC-type sugar transport system substrate-binding protein
LLAVTASVLAISITACSSSKTNTTSPTTASSGTTAGSATTTGSSALAAAQSKIAQLEQQPTQITDTAKVTGTVPKGLLVEFIPCGPNPECQQEGQIVAQAAHLLGWTAKTIPNDGTTQGDKAAFDTVVRDKPTAVLYTAIPQAVFQSDVASLKANKTAVVSCCVTDTVGNGVDYNIDSPEESAPVGATQGDFVAVNSNCQNADSVVINIPDFAILTGGVNAMKSQLKTDCPGVNVSELDISLANIANTNTQVVSFLRAHTNVHYVVASTDGVTIGLPAAMTAAGLSSVKLVGQGATPQNIQYLHAGQEAGDIAFPYNEVIYAMMTAAVEHAAGQPITASVAPPLWVLTPQNAPNTGASIFPVVNDYQKQYEALWGISS